MFPLCILSAVLFVNFKLSTSNVAAMNLTYDDDLGSNSSVLEESYDYSDRIVGGDVANIEKYPSTVLVLVHDSVDPGMGVCAGAIVHSSWVLIAAHCIHGKEPHLIDVRAGSSYFDRGGDSHRVAYLKTYEDFLQTALNLYFDIGLMKVYPDFDFEHPNIQPAILPDEANSGLETGAIITMVGWGRFEKFASNPGWPVSDVIREVTNIVIPVKNCPTSITDPHHAFCSVSPDEVLRGAMNGDSGSPVYLGNTLVGIHSGGSDVTKHPTEEILNKHSNVSYFLSWIADVIEIGRSIEIP